MAHHPKLSSNGEISLVAISVMKVSRTINLSINSIPKGKHIKQQLIGTSELKGGCQEGGMNQVPNSHT